MFNPLILRGKDSFVSFFFQFFVHIITVIIIFFEMFMYSYKIKAFDLSFILFLFSYGQSHFHKQRYFML